MLLSLHEKSLPPSLIAPASIAAIVRSIQLLQLRLDLDTRSECFRQISLGGGWLDAATPAIANALVLSRMYPDATVETRFGSVNDCKIKSQRKAERQLQGMEYLASCIQGSDLTYCWDHLKESAVAWH